MVNPSGCTTLSLFTKEELNPQKQVSLLNLRSWLAQKPKMGSIFMGICLYKNNMQCKS